MEWTIKQVSTKDRIPFRCTQCGACCRNVEDKIMLEPYDAYLLGQHLRQYGVVETMDDVFAKYAHPIMLSEGFPIFTLNTQGEDQHCVFLKHDRCSIYDSRLRVCRLYPFTVKNGERGRRFEFYQCLDRHTTHFYGSSVQVNDWMYQNFTKTDRAIMERETILLPELGNLLRQLSKEQQELFLFHLLYYRYYNYDLDVPFLEQYDRNHTALLQELRQRVEVSA